MSEKPYPGLRPFRRDETDIYFGREAQTDELLERLGRSRFIAVLGVSGCGKSSLVRTGLIAGLESGFLASTGPRWRVAEMRPQHQPLTNLAQALFDQHVSPAELQSLEALREHPNANRALRIAIVRRILQRGPLAIQELLHQYPLAKNTNLLLVVDQFEEIFRYRQLGDTDEADAFVALLLESSRLQKLPVHIVITMRSDFLGDCAVFRRLPEVINEGLFLVPRLTREQLRNAIEGPAAVFGGRLEPGLVNHLLNSAGDDPDQLPVLQHALMRMCAVSGACHLEHEVINFGGDITPSFTITLAHYQQVGGLKEALSLHADEAFNSLDATQKAIARRLFQCLTERGPDHRDTRRPLRLDEIANIAEVDWQEVAAVVEHFRQPDRCFLTPSMPTPLAPDTLLDISHESLIRQWHRLNAWVEEEAQSATQYRRLEDAARQWEELNRPNEVLWIPPILDIARQWVQEERPNAYWAQRYGEHYPLAKEYLHASEQHDKQKKAREKEARQQELRRVHEIADLRQQQLQHATHLAGVQQRNLRKTRIVLLAVTLLFVTAAVTSYWAWRAGARAEDTITTFFDSKIADASEFIKEENFLEAREMLDDTRTLDQQAPPKLRHARNLLLWKTHFMGGTFHAQYPHATDKSGTIYRDITLSEDGRWLVGASTEGMLVLLDPQTLKPQGDYIVPISRQCPKQEIRQITIDPKSRWLAIGGDLGCVTLLDVSKRRIIAQWQVDRRVFSMASNHAGTLLAIASADNSIELWNPDTGEKISALTGHDRPAHGLAFAPDGQQLLSVSYENTLRVWNVNTGEELSPSWSDGDRFSGAIVFHPNGSEVAIGRSGGHFAMWDVQRRKVRESLHHPGYRVTDLEFLLEGKLIVSSGTDHALRLWDTETGVLLRVLQGHDGPITDVAGREGFIYSAGLDGKVISWKADVRNTNSTSQSSKSSESSESSEFAAAEFPAAQMASAASRSPSAVALAPNNQFAAVGFLDGQLVVYSLDDLERLWAKPAPNAPAGSENLNDPIKSGYSPVESGYIYSSKGLPTLWEKPKAHAGAIVGLTFDSDGSRIFSTDSDGHVKGWRTKDGSVSRNRRAANSLLNNHHKYTERAPDNALKVGAVLSPDHWQLLTLGSQESGVGLEFWNVPHLNALLDKPDRPLNKPAQGINFIRQLQGNAVEGLLFSIQIRGRISDLQDFDFRCTERSRERSGRCLISVASRSGKLMFYNLGAPYD